MQSVHQPVLLKEAIGYLNLRPDCNVIDCTFGGGGHSQAALEKIKPNGRLLAIDMDAHVRKNTKQKRVIFVNDNFRNLRQIVDEYFPYPVHGILLDLGLSSDQLEESGRGFSFQKDEPLDMRFDVRQDLTAADILNFYSLEKLYDIFKNYGEYPHARRLCQSILEWRKIKKFKTTGELVELVLQINPRRFKDKIHPATKVFQALRIAVNGELTSLARVLPQATEILAPSGRLVVIAFHALEDRIVKNFFRQEARMENSRLKLLTKKPVTPSKDEVRENPRSRSAKLRCIEKI